MKTLATQVAAFLAEPESRRNVRLLLKLLAFSIGVVVLYTVLFHEIMAWEGQEHSWLTGLYWTLVTMSTLGFGDIVFDSDLGRMFSAFVLLSGVMLLLVVLPFAFIQYLYAPWLQAQLRSRVPRQLKSGTADHVIICEWDAVGGALAERLEKRGLAHVVIETDSARALELVEDGHEVVLGEPDDVDFLRKLCVDRARLVYVNRHDTVNTNITLTAREISEVVPLLAVAEEEQSVDVLELAGATKVLPLKRWLGEQLANRVGSDHAQAQVVGQYRNLLLAELPVRNTPLVGRTIRQTKLRAGTGVSILGVWERGHLHPARPDHALTERSVIVVAGTQDQLDTLDEILLIYNVNDYPVVVVGGGRVGHAAADALLRKNLDVHLVEQDPKVCKRFGSAIKVFEGNAADFTLMQEAGIARAPAVVLTTHDDAVNVYLASYCRRLNPDLRIICRVTHQRNVEAVHRAGADFALSYTALGVAAVMAELDDRELAVLGGELDLFTEPLPHPLVGKTLAESGIGAKTGLQVLAVEYENEFVANPSAATTLHADAELVLIGDEEQRRLFRKTYA